LKYVTKDGKRKKTDGSKAWYVSKEDFVLRLVCTQEEKEMTRNEMQTKIIMTFGFEDENTIEFFKMCDLLPETAHNNKVLHALMNNMIERG